MSIVVPGGQSYVPQEVQDRLSQIDPRLYIQPKQRRVYDSGAEDDHPETQWVWYVVLRWPEGDPRWRNVQTGNIPAESAFDMLGQIPVDCPLEQVPGYLARQLKASNGVPRVICDDIAAWNADQQIRNGAPVSELAAELFEANKNTIFAKDGVVAPKPVSQFNPPQTGKKNRPKEA